jgi:phage shock protein C
MTQLKLTRNTTNRIISGVCSGLGDYLGLDATLARAAFVILALASGIGIPLYLVLALVLPKEADVDLPLGDVVTANLQEFGQTLAQMGQNSHENQTAALVLILLGGYLFLYRLGLLGAGFFGPFVLILVGVLVFRRWQQGRDNLEK